MESRNALTISNTDLEAERKPFTTGKAKQEMGRIKKQEWTNQIEFFLSCISYKMLKKIFNQFFKVYHLKSQK